MQDTRAIAVHITNSRHSKTIHTTLTDPLRNIFAKAGFKWFEAVSGPIELSMEDFEKVEELISKRNYYTE